MKLGSNELSDIILSSSFVSRKDSSEIFSSTNGFSGSPISFSDEGGGDPISETADISCLSRSFV